MYCTDPIGYSIRYIDVGINADKGSTTTSKWDHAYLANTYISFPLFRHAALMPGTQRITSHLPRCRR
jgi:hypothetical protein